MTVRLLASLILLSTFGAQNPEEAMAQTPQETPETRQAPPVEQTGPPTVYLSTQSGKRIPILVELAQTPRQRERGLMFRKSLPDGRGMLFLMGRLANHSFWMRNTKIPLDMIFIDERGEIVGIVHRAVPETLTGRSVGRVSLYVLEVRGGYAQENKIEPGSWVDLSEALP